MRVLVVEDSERLEDTLKDVLMKAGYMVDVAGDGQSGYENAVSGIYDIIILDLMLPKMNGYEVLSAIREEGHEVPVLILSAKTELDDKVDGFALGADDYVTKPFSPAELTARIDALCRRTCADEDEPDTDELVHGPFLLNTRTRTLEKNGVGIRLTQIEYSIMSLFMRSPGKALAREDILAAVWGRDYVGELKIVDVNIRRLRIKIEDDPTAPVYIVTNWGYGYTFN